LGDEFTLNFATENELFLLDTNQKSDISFFQEIQVDSIEGNIEVDTAAINSRIRTIKDSTRRAAMKLQYKDVDKSALNSFFKHLKKSSKSGDRIRIIHFGDSQIEGDRITGYVRNKLQNQFGGNGPGILPALNYVPNMSFNYETSANWVRHPIFGRRDSLLKHKKYGSTGTFCRFAPFYSEPDSNDVLDIHEATLAFSPNSKSYRKFRSYSQCRLFYGNNKQPVSIQVFNDGELIKTDSLLPNNNVNVLKLNFDTTPKRLEFKFRGKDSPDIYGVALDAHSGIAMDNIPMRGSGGTIFNKMNRKSMQEMYSHLNVRLLILQYGGNIVPHVKSKKSCENYGRWFKSQIKTLKGLCPKASIIVIGPSDMSHKVKTNYETYPFVSDVRDALKSAAFEMGCAYWDLYEVMGGKNAMPSWVNASPPLAAPDYIHFSRRGAKKMAELFYNALIQDYNNFKK